MMKDGWHIVSGYEVYVEDGKVKRGILRDKTVWPYRKNRYGNGWDNCAGLTVAAFRAGVARGTVKMF